MTKIRSRKMVVVRGVRYRYEDAEQLGLLDQVDEQPAIASTLANAPDPVDDSQGESSTGDADDVDETSDADDVDVDETSDAGDEAKGTAEDEKPGEAGSDEGDGDGAGTSGRRRAARRRSA